MKCVNCQSENGDSRDECWKCGVNLKTRTPNTDPDWKSLNDKVGELEAEVKKLKEPKPSGKEGI